MLIAYRDTLHPATGVKPEEAMHDRPIFTRLDNQAPRKTDQREKDREIDERDKEYEKRMTHHKRKCKEKQIRIEELCASETEED
jgi:hypothetical protein